VIKLSAIFGVDINGLAGSLLAEAMHLIYQSQRALISYAKNCTVHGGLFFAYIRVNGLSSLA
jgi:hypothetical protein